MRQARILVFTWVAQALGMWLIATPQPGVAALAAEPSQAPPECAGPSTPEAPTVIPALWRSNPAGNLRDAPLQIPTPAGHRAQRCEWLMPPYVPAANKARIDVIWLPAATPEAGLMFMGCGKPDSAPEDTCRQTIFSQTHRAYARVMTETDPLSCSAAQKKSFAENLSVLQAVAKALLTTAEVPSTRTCSSAELATSNAPKKKQFITFDTRPPSASAPAKTYQMRVTGGGSGNKVIFRTQLPCEIDTLDSMNSTHARLPATGNAPNRRYVVNVKAPAGQTGGCAIYVTQPGNHEFEAAESKFQWFSF